MSGDGLGLQNCALHALFILVLEYPVHKLRLASSSEQGYLVLGDLNTPVVLQLGHSIPTRGRHSTLSHVFSFDQHVFPPRF